MTISIHADHVLQIREWSEMHSEAVKDPFVFSRYAAKIPGPLMPMMHAIIAYKRAGESVFVLGENQQRQFLDMDLSGLPLEDLKFPFDSFYVALDGCGFTLRASNTEGVKEHRVRGVYITRVPSKVEPWHIYVGTREMYAKNSELVDGLSLCVWAHSEFAHPHDDVMFTLPVHFAPGMSAASDVVDMSRLNSDPTVTSDDELHNARVGASMLKIVVGMCAYLQSRECQVQVVDPSEERKALLRRANGGGKKAAKAMRRLVKIPKVSYTVVAPGMVYVPPESRTVTTHWRRGHVRKVWVGPRVDELGNKQRGTHQEVRFIEACLVEGADRERVPVTYIVE